MKKNNIFWGLVLIMAAGMVLLHSFGLDPGIGVFRLLIGIVLAAILIKSVVSFHVEGICFSAAFFIIMFSSSVIPLSTPWKSNISVKSMFALNALVFLPSPSAKYIK